MNIHLDTAITDPRKRRFIKAALAAQQLNHSKPVLVGIDGDAISSNVAVIRRRIGTRGLCAVLKGDAYGHGTDIVASRLVSQCSHMAAVDNHELEGLRKLASDIPLIRLRVGSEAEIAHAAQAGWCIREMAASHDKIERIGRIYEHVGTQAEIHLSLDAAGLGRNGFAFSGIEEVDALAGEILDVPNVRLASIACHLPDAGSADPLYRSDPSRVAISRFYAAVRVFLHHIRERGHELPEISAYSSASSRAFGDLQDLESLGCRVFDRIGSSLLGLTNGNRHGENGTAQVMHVATAVCDVVRRQRGESIGYEHAYKVQEQTGEEVALIGVGWLTLSRYQQGLGKTGTPAYCIGPDGSPHQFLGRQSMNISTIAARSAQGNVLSIGDMVFLATDFDGMQSAPTISCIATWMGSVQHEFVTSAFATSPSSMRFLF